jgi:hypothetical protein
MFHSKKQSLIITSISILAILLTAILRFKYGSEKAASWDQVDFSLGVMEFDLLSMQPHFPGYPYFILGGMFFSLITDQAPLALSYFNSTLLLSSVIPIYMLARKLLSRDMALLLAALVQTSSYVNVMGIQPMSEGAAIGILTWYVWVLYEAIQRDKTVFRVTAMFLFSVLLGIRVSYVLFGTGLLYMWWMTFKKLGKSGALVIIGELVIAVCFQLIWLIGLAANVGGWGTLFEIGFGFSKGHFIEWGGTSLSNEASLWKRIFLLVFNNILWTGFFSQDGILVVLFTIAFMIRLKCREQPRLLKFILVFIVSYFFWALFAQNIDKPRHILPIVVLGLFYIGARLLRRNTKSSYLLIIVFILAQSVMGAMFMKKQHDEEPAVYQLAKDLTNKYENSIVYTWEETRVLGYLNVPFEHKRIMTYDKFLEDLSYKKDKTVLLTDKVRDGFIQQGANPNHFKKITSYKSTKLFDPIYSQITLYKWEGSER